MERYELTYPIASTNFDNDNFGKRAFLERYSKIVGKKPANLTIHEGKYNKDTDYLIINAPEDTEPVYISRAQADKLAEDLYPITGPNAVSYCNWKYDFYPIKKDIPDCVIQMRMSVAEKDINTINSFEDAKVVLKRFMSDFSQIVQKYIHASGVREANKAEMISELIELVKQPLVKASRSQSEAENEETSIVIKSEEEIYEDMYNDMCVMKAFERRTPIAYKNTFQNKTTFNNTTRVPFPGKVVDAMLCFADSAKNSWNKNCPQLSVVADENGMAKIREYPDLRKAPVLPHCIMLKLPCMEQASPPAFFLLLAKWLKLEIPAYNHAAIDLACFRSAFPDIEVLHSVYKEVLRDNPESALKGLCNYFKISYKDDDIVALSGWPNLSQPLPRLNFYFETYFDLRVGEGMDYEVRKMPAMGKDPSNLALTTGERVEQSAENKKERNELKENSYSTFLEESGTYSRSYTPRGQRRPSGSFRGIRGRDSYPTTRGSYGRPYRGRFGSGSRYHAERQGREMTYLTFDSDIEDWIRFSSLAFDHTTDPPAFFATGLYPMIWHIRKYLTGETQHTVTLRDVYAALMMIASLDGTKIAHHKKETRLHPYSPLEAPGWNKKNDVLPATAPHGINAVTLVSHLYSETAKEFWSWSMERIKIEGGNGNYKMFNYVGELQYKQ